MFPKILKGKRIMTIRRGENNITFIESTYIILGYY